MLSGKRFFAYPTPADLRNGYNGLFRMVKELGHDPLAGDVVLFVNRRRSSCKVLGWDGTGLCLKIGTRLSKRLERGSFAKLWKDGDGALSLSEAELRLFFEGSRHDFVRQKLSPPPFVLKAG